MIEELNSVKCKSIEWIHSHLRSCSICIATKKGKSSEYTIGDKVIKLPTDPGIYAMYPKVDWMYNDTPIYVGEASNLRQRINYHFSESQSAKKESTLKKALLKLQFKRNKPTCDLVCFKYVKIPFGRKEIETLLHEHYSINTKKK
jgi:hypothetical protein